MLDLPFDDLTDPLRLADWLELYALLSPDRNSSRGDLESALRTASLLELDDDEKIEQKSLEVFEELEQRKKAAREGYPYDLDYGIIRLRSGWENFPIYVFCLCLSYFRLSETNKAPKLFEKASCLAAKGYLQGDAIEFGWPRGELPPLFPDAVTEICRHIGEGEGFRTQPSLDRRDDTLDLVAWKEFADQWPGKVLMFGQCASGRQWENKLGELDPPRFCSQWMQIPPISPGPIKAFFIPHRVEWDKWEYVSRSAGILFDRCRIAFWAHQEKADCSLYISWVKDLLARVAP